MSAKALGKDIIGAIVANLQEAREPLRYSTLVPSIYDVYLHPDDHDRLAGVFPRIRDEARRALAEEVARLDGRKKRLLPGLSSHGTKHQPVESDWYIQFHKDEDEELAPGDILVDSQLTLPPEKEYGAGGKTQRNVTVTSSGETRKLKRSQEEPKPSAAAIARLVYQDRAGNQKVFMMTSEEISIGRGGRTEYCDLELDAPPDISRQHFYLRRDESTREFFIQDVSRFGTTVNGKGIEPKQWVPLPARARIGLAGKMAIDFETL
jgi:hypothetical protein